MIKVIWTLFFFASANIPHDADNCANAECEDAVFVQTRSVERRSQAWMTRMEEQMSEMARTVADQAMRIKQLEADHVAQCDFCDLVRTCVDTTPTNAPPTTTTTTVKRTPAPTPAPTIAPTPHPCDDGSHGCDKGDGGICYKVDEGVNDKGYMCDCAQGYVCTAGCDEMFDGHTCSLATEAPTPAPTVGVCAGFTDAYPDLVEVDLQLSEVSHNNLGGKGPDEGDEELYFKNAAVHNGAAYDLKVTVVGDSYTPANSNKNGQAGYYGQINVLSGTSVDVKFQFVDQNSGEPAAIQTVISWFDTDMGMQGGGKESIIPWAGYSKTLLASTSELKEETVSCPGGGEGTCEKFSATTGGNAADNPDNPLTLTAQQAARTFAVYYEDVSEIRFTLVADTGSGGRNFLFTGMSEIAYTLVKECCPDHICDTATTTTTTPEPTDAPTPAPTPHPCDDGSHGCDKGDGGICYKVEEGGVNDEGWMCDCAQGYECTEGCDNMFEGHKCVATAAPTQEPTAEPTPAPTTTTTTPEPTAAPTPAPTPHPCDDGSHGCDKGDGGICYKVEEGGVNDEGWMCDCAQGWECAEGCDEMFEGHKCVETAAPTQAPTSEPTPAATTTTTTPEPTPEPTAEPTVAPTSVEDIACEQSVTFDMSLDRLKENTLGQPGGHMLFKNTITVDGVGLDLSVTDASNLPQYADKGYTTFDGDSRKYTGSFLSAGRIAIDKPGDYIFRFKFIDTNSGAPGKLPLFPVTFYDNDGGAEQITACNVEFAILDPNTNLDETFSDGCYTHKAPGKEVNLPDDWDDLSGNQRRVSVSYVYKDTGEFDIGLSLLNVENRYFVFKSSKAFACALADDFGQGSGDDGDDEKKGTGKPKKKKKKAADN